MLKRLKSNYSSKELWRNGRIVSVLNRTRFDIVTIKMFYYPHGGGGSRNIIFFFSFPEKCSAPLRLKLTFSIAINKNRGFFTSLAWFKNYRRMSSKSLKSKMKPFTVCWVFRTFYTPNILWEGLWADYYQTQGLGKQAILSEV